MLFMVLKLMIQAMLLLCNNPSQTLFTLLCPSLWLGGPFAYCEWEEEFTESGIFCVIVEQELVCPH